MSLLHLDMQQNDSKYWHEMDPVDAIPNDILYMLRIPRRFQQAYSDGSAAAAAAATEYVRSDYERSLRDTIDCYESGYTHGITWGQILGESHLSFLKGNDNYHYYELGWTHVYNQVI